MSENELITKIEKSIDFGMKYAEKLKVKSVEGFGYYSNSLSLELEKKKPKHNLGILHGVSFRVIANDAIGFAYTTDFDESSIKRAVDTALANTKAIPPDKELVEFAEPKPIKKLPLDEKLYNIEPDQASELFEQLLPEELPKDIYFLASMGMFSSNNVLLKNDRGLELKSEDTGYALGIGFLSTHGFPTYDFYLEGSKKWGELNPETITKKAIEKTLAGADPKTLNISGEFPVILTPDASMGMFGGLFFVLTSILQGDKASRGETPYADKIGEQVAAENFTLIDDPLATDLIMTAEFDGEGTPTQRTELIKDGILQTYYLDRYYANKLNMESNGKATRGGLMEGNPAKSPPSIGSYNTIVEPGDSSYEEMIAETKEGFAIKSLMGIHMSDFSSGRFAVTGAGWYIKNGEIKFPVQDISISGTIPQLLKDIDLISKERAKGIMSNMPYIRVSNLHIAAKKLDFKVRFGIKLLKLLVKLGIVKNPFV